MEVKHYTDNDGRPMVLLDDGRYVVVTSEELFLKNGTNMVLGSVGKRFDPKQSSVGNLVDVDRKVNASQERSNPVQPVSGVGDLVGQKLGAWKETPPPPEKTGVGDLVGQPLGAWLPPKVIAEAGASHSSRPFDPMLPTVGSLIGKKLGESEETAEAAATVNENSSAHFDPSKPTVGDLIGAEKPTLIGRTSSVEPAECSLHPHRIKEVRRC